MITITGANGNVETMTEDEFRRRRGSPWKGKAGTAAVPGPSWARRRARGDDWYSPIGDGVEARFDPHDFRQQVSARE